MPAPARWRACLGAVIHGALGGDEDLAPLVSPLGVAQFDTTLEALVLAYPSLLNFEIDSEGLKANPVPRKRQGAYYTPPALAQRLAELAVLSVGEVLDPACGAGALLIAAGDRMEQQDLDRLHGMDSDPIAVLLCRHAMRRWAGLSASRPLPSIRVGDALTHDWGDDRFDAIVANPPFGNVVEGMVPDSAKQVRAEKFPELGGTADYAYYFSSLSARLLKPEGRAALVQPRAFVSANSTRDLREKRIEGTQLASVEEFLEPDMFEAAAVYVCIATFENRAHHPGLPFEVADELESAFEITASMTVAQAYQLKEYLCEGEKGLRLVTTGLIDPDKCHWGERPCRYLKSDYLKPTLSPDAPLQQRMERASRPKLIVAGLSSQLEAFLDEDGRYIGAVSTYTITHKLNDVAALRRVLSRLLSPEASLAFRQQLGASAMGGGSITVTKAFLQQLLAQV